MSRYEVASFENLLSRLNSIHRISAFWQDYFLARSSFQNYLLFTYIQYTHTHTQYTRTVCTHACRKKRHAQIYIHGLTHTYCLRFVVYMSKRTQDHAQCSNINKYYKTFLIVEQTVKEMIKTNQKFYFSQNINPYLKSIRFTLHLNLNQVITSDQILSFLQPSKTPTFSTWLIL